MRLLSLSAAAAVALAAVQPALAQNAGQIEHARGGASCPHCNLFQADFSNLEMKDRDFAGARLRQADFSAAVMNHTSFAGGDLRDVNAYGAVLSGASFAGTNLTNATFVWAYLEGAKRRRRDACRRQLLGRGDGRKAGLHPGPPPSACGGRRDDAFSWT